MGALGWSLLFAVGFSLLAVGLRAFCDSYEKNPLAAGLITFVITFPANFLLTYFGIAQFSYLLVGGVPLLGFSNFLIAVLVGCAPDLGDAFDSGDISGAVQVGIGFFAVCLLVWGIIIWITPPMTPVWLDNAGWDQMAAILKVEDGAGVREDTGIADLLVIAPETALNEARSHIPPELSSFLEANKAHLQQVGGHWYYIIDLKVQHGNRRAFNDNGGVIPGYLVMDAQSVGSKIEFKPGYKMQYVPSALWGEDLATYVHNNFTLKTNRWRVLDLDTLEVDDNWNPRYTGTLYKHTVGYEGLEADGVIVVDPQTGEIDAYPLNKVPDWVDRVYSMDTIRERAEWWARYSQWDSVFLKQNTRNKWTVDAITDVVGPHGRLEYQVTLTAFSKKDSSLVSVLYVDPRTGDAIRYPLSGKTLSAVDDIIGQESKRLQADGYEPVECELQTILGSPTWYCILVGRSDSATGNAGSHSGVGFVQAQNTSNNTAVIVAKELDDGFRLLRQQIANAGRADPNIQVEGANLIQVTGRINRMGLSGDNYQFTLAGENAPRNVVFRVPATNAVISLCAVGDTVTVTAYELYTDQVTDVVSITNSKLPDYINKNQ